MPRPRIALISNPKSTGNIAQLPRIRAFCAQHPDIFHYEVEAADQIGEAMKTIALVRPAVLAINGGDGTVQAVLTELHNGGHFGDDAPPVAVLPSGKTNLIALDLGARGDPIEALTKLLEIARADLAPHLVARELISLSGGETGLTPVIGMFLGGAGLADVMLYCRERIYPLGLPNGISHFITAIAVFLRQVVGLRASFLPPEPAMLRVQVRKDGAIDARFALLFVTTLEKLLLSSDVGSHRRGPLKFVAVEQGPLHLLRALGASVFGRLGRSKLTGVHVEEADEIAIEGESSRVILDGETFRSSPGKPILLRPAQPLSFVRIAAWSDVMSEALTRLVEQELAEPVDARVAEMAEAVAARHGEASRAVMFYGSCLREKQLDGLMLDFYLIVTDYASAYDKAWLAKANAVIPPNVFPFEHHGLMAKYAVLSERDFYRLNGPETRNVSVWARFAQPARLVWSADDAARRAAIRAVSRAAPTLLAAAGKVAGEAPLDWWRRAFALTYSAELRAERKGRAGSVVDSDADRYRRFSVAAIASIDPAVPAGGWARRRIEGKMLSVVRLAKASATYAGGAEYIAWKINRHAGTEIVLSDWQKRHPLLAAISLLPKLLRSGAIR